MIFSFSQFTFLSLSPLPACLHAFLLVIIHMVFDQWSDSRHFLNFSVSLVLPQYETVQFVPPSPEEGKPGSSVLMFHEVIYQGLIVRFTLLEEVFSSLVCARAKSELSNHSVSLSTQAHMRVLESTLSQDFNICFYKISWTRNLYACKEILLTSSKTSYCKRVTDVQ